MIAVSSTQRFFGIAALAIYFSATIVTGWLSRRRKGSANSFLNASRSLPLPIVVAAYLAANCGALEMVGMSAFAAQYGVQALHFYFIGAIPAIIFLALWMMPVYSKSGVTSVPAYIEQRFGSRMRLWNACVTGCIMPLLGGVSLYAMAQVLAVLVDLSFHISILLCAAVVLTYVLLGGVRATIYNEFLQLSVILAGLIPLSIRLLHGGAFSNVHGTDARFHLWQGMRLFDRGSSVDALGLVVGLGFVLSFSYWCTDFVLMQRAFTTRTEYHARQVPLWAGFGKLAFSLLVVFPGVAAMMLIPGLGSSVRADQALPSMMRATYGPALLGVGITALAASLMSGLSANASGFAAIWTEEIYRPFLHRHARESHYVLVGRLASIGCLVIAAAAAYLNFSFGNMMEHVQLIFSIAGPPFWAVFLLGMASRRTNSAGVLIGFLTGLSVSLLFLWVTWHGWIRYASRMNANFHIAILGFLVTAVVSYGGSQLIQRRNSPPVATNLVFQWKRPNTKDERRLWLLAAVLGLLCAGLNYWWW